MDAIRRFEGTMVNGGLGALDHIVATGGYFFWRMPCAKRV